MSRLSNAITGFGLLLAIIIVVNVISELINIQVDLNEYKRFSISDNTKDIVNSIDDNISIRILLDGEFPAGFKRLQSSVNDMLIKLRDINHRINFEFEDPSSGSLSEIEQKRKILQDENIIPVSLSYSDGTQLVQKAVYPFAIFNYGARKFIVNLLEEQKPGDDEELILNNSVSLLEYKFSDALLKLMTPRPKNILFTHGNGELDDSQTYRLESELRKFNKVGGVVLDSIMHLDSTIDLVIVAGLRKSMSIQNQFKLDQYIMQGGKIIWMIDKFHVSLDSINKYKFYIPTESDTGIDDLLFKYGIRIMPDLIIDLECSSIPQVVGMAGDKPQTKLFPWVYHIVAAPNSDHPITKHIDRINFFFPSTIDTIKSDGQIKKTILVSSSKYSRSQLSPMRLSFEILKVAPDPSKFNDGLRPVAVLLEGEFESYFKNRVTPEFKQLLQNMHSDFKERSSAQAKQLIISDSDFAKNLVNTATGNTEDIGYNKWERKYYKGNKDFILNTVEYMLDENNVLETRSKDIKLRLLDNVRIKQEKLKWQLINVVLPVVLLIIFGLIYHYFRKRKYTFR
ncbi:MAG: gliding motility-associated ABC transporter substrate-binding protein GldG [Saprospiraceae bacterium]|nr:gliding motility-associated ABC transporter substrate-binding protein GldG [Saprospiraceae bacterium]